MLSDQDDIWHPDKAVNLLSPYEALKNSMEMIFHFWRILIYKLSILWERLSLHHTFVTSILIQASLIGYRSDYKILFLAALVLLTVNVLNYPCHSHTT